MAIAWSGFPFAKLVELRKPLASAKYVRMETFLDTLPWLRDKSRAGIPGPMWRASPCAEATNELAFLVTGAYGKPVSRTTRAHRYASRCRGNTASSQIKLNRALPLPISGRRAIGRRCSYRQGAQLWANVNPQVSHPRWSQSDGGADGTSERVPTLLFNGYGEYVADLYEGSRKSGCGPDRRRAQPPRPAASTKRVVAFAWLGSVLLNSRRCPRGSLLYETIPKRGYRVVASVRSASQGVAPPVAPRETLRARQPRCRPRPRQHFDGCRSTPNGCACRSGGRGGAKADGTPAPLAAARAWRRRGARRRNRRRARAAAAVDRRPRSRQWGRGAAVRRFSPAADRQYFADGVHEEVITRLSTIAGLRVSVVSRGWVAIATRANQCATSVAGFIGVDAVMQGSVRYANDRVRVTAQDWNRRC